MKVLIVPDKFKGSLTANSVIEAIRLGLQDRAAGIETHAITASDGGDGFLEAVRRSDPEVELCDCQTTDPLGRPIEARYGFSNKTSTAFVEMAKASGMELLADHELNPSATSTLGTGTLMVDAVRRGAKRVYVGLGGSATTDGGTGIATAFGYRLLDRDGHFISPTGGDLQTLAAIDSSAAFVPNDVQFFAINDVRNPLLGSQGASRVYAPQKGASPAMVDQLEANLTHLDKVVRRDLAKEASEIPGTGAAGGTGFGLHVFLDAPFLSGIEFVFALTGIESLLAKGDIDLMITGEGRIDDQTSFGKLVSGVASVGRKFGVPVIAVCGISKLENRSKEDIGVEEIYQLHDGVRPVDETIREASSILRRLVSQFDLESFCK